MATTEYTQEQKDCARLIRDKKKPIESAIIGCLYIDPTILEDYDLKRQDFLYNEFRVLFEIANQMYKEKTTTLDEISINLYLEKHSKLAEKYEELGGYDVIELGKSLVEIENIESYVNENTKYNVFLEMIKSGYPIWTLLDKKDENGLNYWDKSLEDIYNEWDNNLQSIFVKANGITNKIEDLSDNIDKNIEDWNRGEDIGMPFYKFPRLTSITNGFKKGEILLLGGCSNVGKSSFLRQMFLPTLMKYQIPSLTILNEEKISTWQQLLILSIANNILDKELTYRDIMKGSYTIDTRNTLKECGNYLKELKEERLLNFISFDEWDTSKAIKIMKKVSNANVSVVSIDTFKASNNRDSYKRNTWEQLKSEMVSIYNTARKKDLAIIATMQLKLELETARYLGMSSIAESKGVCESCATVLLIRRMFSDEYFGERNEIKVFDIIEGKQEIIQTDSNKDYFILFCAKNRRGSKKLQVVCEVDFSRSIIKEIGYCCISPSFGGDK